MRRSAGLGDKTALRVLGRVDEAAGEVVARARRFVAVHAVDATEGTELLAMLGLSFTAEEIAERRGLVAQDRTEDTVIQAEEATT